MRVEVTNLTKWHTGDLRKLLTCSAKRVHVQQTKHVLIRRARVRRHPDAHLSPEMEIHGRGWIGDRRSEGEGTRLRSSAFTPEDLGRNRAAMAHEGKVHHVTLWLPSPKYVSTPEILERFLVRLACVAEHEFLHNLGAGHGDMTPEQRQCQQGAPYVSRFPMRVADGRFVCRSGPNDLAAERKNRMELVKDAENALEELEQADDSQALEALGNLRQAAEAYFAAKDAKKTVARSSKENVDQAWESLKTNIEEPTKTNDTKDKLVGKLRRIEGSYQDYEDAVAYSKEEKKAAAEEVKAAKEALQRAVEESKQIPLPGM